GAAVTGGVAGGAAASPARPEAPTAARTCGPTRSRLTGRRDVDGTLATVEPATVGIRRQAFRGNDLFGGGQVVGAGTGMILTTDGEVLTNNHVVAGATSIKVTVFGQSAARDADLLGSDPLDDVALVKMRGGSGLPPVELGESDKAAAGDDAVDICDALAQA